MSDSLPSTLTVESLPVLVHQNARVVTTDLLAQLYGTEGKNIRDNFERNSDRFEPGKHFHKLDGDDLRAFKHSTAQSGSVKIARNVNALLLWTERGAARHAKMLDTDQAWEVFEKLEDAYFRVVVEPPTAISYTVQPTDSLTAEEQAEIRAAMTEAAERLPKEKQRQFMVQGWSKLKAHFNCAYREIPRPEFAEAMSLVSRHIAEFGAGPKALPVLADSDRERLARECLSSARFCLAFDSSGTMLLCEIPAGKIMLAPVEIASYIKDPGGLVTMKMLPEIAEAAIGRIKKTLQ